ncbi:unnamed protein product [Brassicogethes aeneus]|uniref:L antigen family member 3 n=1 Tax=Brassicogethes aeneus TaxID=1431903 RepID=A0A9P0FJD1_BRAAE|nr:unnamed protein product [Brassicogethes aeneus]
MGVTLNIEVPFPNNQQAQIVYDVLRVDREPSRSGVEKELKVKDCILVAKFTAELPRQIRVSINGFFDKIDLITETFDNFGPPVSESYSHFNNA